MTGSGDPRPLGIVIADSAIEPQNHEDATMRRVEQERRDARWALWMAGAAMIALAIGGWRERGRSAPTTEVPAMTAAVAGSATVPAAR